MFRETIMDIFADIWPMMFISSIILISIRVAYLYVKKQKIVLYKELLSLVFMLYILCLFHVVTFQDVSWSTSNFIPFKEMFRYELGSRLFFKNVVGNMIMFLPYGFFIAHFLKGKRPLLITILIFIASFTIETTQLWIGIVFDVDDIILNVLGGLIGYLIYVIGDMIREKLPKFLKTEWFYNIIFLVLILICILYLGNVINIGR